MNLFVKRFLSLTVAAVFIFSSCRENVPVEEASAGEEQADLRYGINTDDYLCETGVVGSGDYFGGLMYRAGLDDNALQRVINASEGVFDIRKIKIGNAYEFFYEKDTAAEKGRAAYFLYERDAMSNVLFSLKDPVSVQVMDKEIEHTRKYAEVEINSSLWVDIEQAGATPVLALKLADIFAWTIDFFALQKGDSFKVIYDELSYNGEFIDIDNVGYCEFVHNGVLYKSVMFRDGDNSGIYWNENGESLRKAFLKAPLNFTRISSRFTYRRKHPIYKVVRPHTGVDYAAPMGTPVVAIGDGTVISRGWGGGGGNTVKIRHNSVYTTAYLHLSRYGEGIRKGVRVKQGQVIGYVGSTGASTGPHLDFRVWKNGTPIDPLKMESPSVGPVSKENMDAFRATYTSAKRELDSLSTLKYVDRILEVLK